MRPPWVWEDNCLELPHFMKAVVFAILLSAGACAEEEGVGVWSPATTLPFYARINAVTLWTGSEMVVWGGIGPCGSTAICDDGGRYDPVAETWSLIPADPTVTAASVTPSRGRAPTSCSGAGDVATTASPVLRAESTPSRTLGGRRWRETRRSRPGPFTPPPGRAPK